jgi:hypothetical protein
MKTKWAIGVILILLISSQGQTGDGQRIIWMSGNKLAAHCKHLTDCERGATCTDDDSVKAGTCMGYIKGVSDATPGVCIPHGTEARQIIRLISQQMNRNPDMLKDAPGEMYMAANIVGDTLRTAYPCAAQKPH